MSLAKRWHYYRRIFRAYLGSGQSQLTFWHEAPEINPRASADRLGGYYMLFREKADYAGHYDPAGIPMLDYHGAIGLQYNPIAIAQWGLANYNRFCETSDEARWRKTLQAADWLAANLEQNAHGLWVWNHHFDWEYRDTLKAPWYSGLAQGQGVSLLLRAHVHAHTEDEKYRYQSAAEKAFASLTRPIAEGGVLFEDAEKNLWIEEYLVDPPTHILNGFIWALWGVFDYWLAGADASAKGIFDRGVETLIHNLARFDTGYWSLYEQSGHERSRSMLKMLASPFYHRLHIVQLRVMSKLTGDARFAAVADRWESYAQRRANRIRALVEKSVFKLLRY
jgi:heparosan-N-sulfate-glucuronate 5-epimerase